MYKRKLFLSARLKLTGYYLLIILIISGFFSVAFYHTATREIDRIMERMAFEEMVLGNGPMRQMRRQNVPTIEELMAYKQRVRMMLVLVDGLILVVAGLGGYMLAGKTLQPIRVMMDEQNQFISDASHELRTPIAIMQAEMEGALLEKKLSESKARRLLASSLEELDSLKQLTNKLLQLTKVHYLYDNGRFAQVALKEVVGWAKRKVMPLAKKKGMTIKVDMPEMMVYGNKEALTEVFLILLDNAIKYSPDKAVVKVEGEKWGRKARVKVIDQGVGMAEAELGQIFERFYRADKSRSGTDGFGLGLSIAKKIVESVRGTIKASSKPDRGMTLTVELPLSSV